jgi:hypothetical protein
MRYADHEHQAPAHTTACVRAKAAVMSQLTSLGSPAVLVHCRVLQVDCCQHPEHQQGQDAGQGLEPVVTNRLCITL